jgi:1-deoxy-D-xylulose-5-phosphate synthase
MIDGTGLEQFSQKFPRRTFDVGIAEQHAVSFAAGMALNGLKPVVAIYSTFLQRAYDEIMLDVCMQNLPVVFAIDRAGVVGADGETHHGIFDLSFLSSMPNMTILAPKDADELRAMLAYAFKLGTPCAIRYPRGSIPAISRKIPIQPIDGSAEICRVGTDATIIAVGKMMTNASMAVDLLQEGGKSIELINARFIKPLDEKTILNSLKKTGILITIEDNTLNGGFGSSVMMMIADADLNGIKVHALGWPDKFIQHGSNSELEKIYKLDPQGLADKVCESIEGKN